MKIKSYIFILSTLVLSVASSCYKDHSSVIEEMIPNIVIEDFEEKYTVESYSGNVLSLTPTIITGYDDSQLTYKWSLIDRQAENTTPEGEKYIPEHLADGKQLNYEVNLAPGDYYIVLQVKADNGYYVTKTINLEVVTSFSEGFYILKETADGNTELDLFNPETSMFKENIFTARDGQPMQGAPGYLSICLDHSYIDVTTNTTTASNVITVTTANGDIHVMRSSDLREVLNRDNLLFETFEEDEVPYRIVSCMWLNTLITNKGIRSQYEGSISAGSTGKYGITNGVQASPWVGYNPDDNGLFFWDNTTSSIGHCDYNGTIVIAEDESYKVSRFRNTECRHIGYNYNQKQTIIVINNRLNNVKQLFQITATASGGYKVDALLNLAEYKVNDAIDFTTCSHSAAYLYGLLADGTIWAYDLVGASEKQIKPAGIPADEHITYISDKSMSSSNPWFIVGTTKGNTYTLRYYSLLGGITDGEPVYTVTGTGTIKSIQYISGALSSYTVSPMQN